MLYTRLCIQNCARRLTAEARRRRQFRTCFEYVGTAHRIANEDARIDGCKDMACSVGATVWHRRTVGPLGTRRYANMHLPGQQEMILTCWIWDRPMASCSRKGKDQERNGVDETIDATQHSILCSPAQNNNGSVSYESLPA